MNMRFMHECEDSPVDEQPAREPSGSADAEARRRTAVLADLHRRRNRRRWIVGVSALAATALIASGSVIAWSSQARAGDLAGQIQSWHEEHERARCELEVRIVSAVGLEPRTQDVLEAAQQVADAEGLLNARERVAFASHRESLLGAIAEDGFVTAEDRELAEAWAERRAASDDPASFDVLDECLVTAAAQRTPVEGVTAERAEALARELRALGDPRDLDDARIDRFEAAIEQLTRSATAAAESRTEITALRALFPLAPEAALASLRDADARLAELLAALRGEPTPSHGLDLVEGLALHVAAAGTAEAGQLVALGEQQEAAALAAAAQQAQDALADAAPPPISDPVRIRPAPAPPPGDAEPAPEQPEPTRPNPPRPGPTPPGEPSEPAPTPPPEPSQPSPTDPAPPEQG